MIILLEGMWDRLQAQTDPVLRASLQCRFATMHKTRIDTTDWCLLTVGQMLDAMQVRIDRQVADAAAPGCLTRLHIVPVRGLSRQCFVRAEFEQEQPLDTALMWLGVRSGLTPRHALPNLEVTLNRPCAWPERPMHFVPEAKASTR